MEIDLDGNGRKIHIDDERGVKLKQEHHAAMINLSVQTTQFEKNTQCKQELVERLEQKNNHHEDERWYKRLFKRHSKETHQS